MENNRDKLPFRKNCEGYLIYDGKIICRNTGKGYLEFPGGGVSENEDPAKALTREAYEEAGVILEGELKLIKIMHFIWHDNWAKTEKQKKRYNEFKGEEMYFYAGRVKELIDAPGDSENNDPGWPNDERLILIGEAIKLIEGFKPFPEEMNEYYEFQLGVLKKLEKTMFNLY
ncbi:NUDIX hydrolase [Candidatus Pacearchaeota archaeon]|nr:NUDIX hydrolase [Candidatus Pacearchaeota archaeon]